MTPDVRVLRGAPDDVELAALVAGIAAGRRPEGPTGDHDRTRREAAAQRRWRDGARPLSDPLAPGPDAWRWSAR